MPIRFSLRQLEYLVAVAETGSIALASEKVRVSSPSISTAIAQLEAEFGFPLFVRKHAQGLSLTQSGREITEQAHAVLAAAARVNDLANEVSRTVRGRLSVGCLLTFAQIVLPQLRRGFVSLYPDVIFSQYERNQTEIFDGLRKSTLDIALTYDLNIPPDLQFIPLVSLPPYAILGEGHDLANQPSVSAKELSKYPMVLLDLPMSSEYFLSFFASQGIRPLIAERTRDMAVMRTLVANDFGYSIANIRLLSDKAPDGRSLRYVPLSGTVRPMRLGLLTAKDANASLTISAFTNYCKAQVTQTSTPGLKLDA